MNSRIFIPLIIIAGIAGGYFYYIQFISGELEPVRLPPLADSDDLRAFEKINIDFSIIFNKDFKSLTTYGESPVNPGTTGKRDIFAP